MKYFFILYLSFITYLFAGVDDYQLPELYQDVLIRGQVVCRGVRSCSDRYQAIKPILEHLPKNFKSLDIGASQGYFSFKMAEEFQARPCMIEEGYTTTDTVWRTGELLHFLCEQNKHLKNVVLLQKKCYASDLKKLKKQERFDLVLAFSVIHHMKKAPDESHAVYEETIDAILDLSPIVLIENPINTGSHTFFIRKILQQRGGVVIYNSQRGSLTYEIYLFDRGKTLDKISTCPNISSLTYDLFNGSYYGH